MYWWQTPPESPNLNPIENLWHELKEYIRCEIKPRTKDELVKLRFVVFLQYCKELKQILQNTSFFIFLSVCKKFPSLAGKPKCF